MMLIGDPPSVLGCARHGGVFVRQHQDRVADLDLGVHHRAVGPGKRMIS